MRGFRIKFRSEEIVVTPDFKSCYHFIKLPALFLILLMPVSKALEMMPWILFG